METETSTISAGVERTTQKFLEDLEASGAPPLEQLSPQEAREVLSNAQKSAKINLPKADVSEKTIQADGQEIRLTIVRPAGDNRELPVFMFFHGGGWVIGDFPTHERLIRDLVAGSGAVAVYVDYSRSPEAQYGTAVNQAYAATKWVAEHGKEINVDGSRLAVAGSSAGGNLAAVTALMAKENGGPDIRFQLLMWPVTDANFETSSYNEVAKGHFLTKNLMKWFWDNYTKDNKKRKEIHASPLQATKQQLEGLPPTLIQVAEFDPLRDEGEAYGRKLDASGVEVTVARYDGMIHDFGMLNALSQVPGTRSAMLQGAQELKRHLE